jgi:CelD/BcsL family acetyltransferase involved in cellulose biosynthesis
MVAITGGISSQWGRESVGVGLIDHAICRARESGVSIVDLGYGGSPWKWRFADRDAPVARDILYPTDNAWRYVAAFVQSDEGRRLVARRAVARLPQAMQDGIASSRARREAARWADRGGSLDQY